MSVFRLLAILSITCLTLPLLGQQSESPYFHITSESETGAFPLLSTKANVQITGPIADVRIVQKYHNDGQEPIEATYVFPASTRAAVYRMEMHICDRVITAQIMERQEAQRTYEVAKKEGKRASLLEQHRPNVFQMQVANIMPGEEVEVYLFYTEFLVPESQQYTFVYPTVVGPRYNSDTGHSPTASFASMPYTEEGITPSYELNIDIAILMPGAVHRVESSTHRISEKRSGKNNVSISLDPSESDGGNRDFILTFDLSGNGIASGVLTYAHGDEKYFLCQIEPPRLDSKPVIVPREYIFIVDVSGSMHGFPLDISKALMKKLLDQLSPSDKFNILFFAGSAFKLSPESVDATKSNVSDAFARMNSMDGGGGTQILPAIKSAMQVNKKPGYARSFVIITDGYVTVEEEAFTLIQDNLDQANFFAFGIGSGVNRHLIEGLAHVGRGEPFVVSDQSEAKSTASRFFNYIRHPLMTDIRIDAHGVELYEITPEHLPDLMAERPIYFFGKYRDGENAQITVTGKRGSNPFTETVTFPAPRLQHSALRYLWAREKLRLLDDFNSVRHDEGRIAEMTQIGLDYNLLTRYTSFVAVDEEIVVENGVAVRKVKQPLPLPQGVSNYAVGFEMDMPETVGEFKATDAQSSVPGTIATVKCSDKETHDLVSSMIENHIMTLDTSELLKHTGKKVTFSIDRTGKYILISGDPDFFHFISSVIIESTNTLGITLAHSIAITVTYGLPFRS